MNCGTIRIPLFHAVVLVAAVARSASAIIVGGEGATAANSTAPTGTLAASGWQFEGQFGAYLGTAIAPSYFITAGHIGQAGQSFLYDGQSYAVIGYYDDPASDLRIWKVDGEMASFAALDDGETIAGKDVLLTGRGTERGSAIVASDGTLIGWRWGAGYSTQRWGTTVAAGTVDGGDGLGTLLTAAFLGTTDATVSVGDSGGGVFVNDDGVWKLAGITYGADIDVTVDGQDVQGAIIGNSLYASSIAADRAWIDSIIGNPFTIPFSTPLPPIPEPAGLVGGAASALALFVRRRSSR